MAVARLTDYPDIEAQGLLEGANAGQLQLEAAIQQVRDAVLGLQPPTPAITGYATAAKQDSAKAVLDAINAKTPGNSATDDGIAEVRDRLPATLSADGKLKVEQKGIADQGDDTAPVTLSALNDAITVPVRPGDAEVFIDIEATQVSTLGVIFEAVWPGGKARQAACLTLAGAPTSGFTWTAAVVGSTVSIRVPIPAGASQIRARLSSYTAGALSAFGCSRAVTGPTSRMSVDVAGNATIVGAVASSGASNTSVVIGTTQVLVESALGRNALILSNSAGPGTIWVALGATAFVGSGIWLPPGSAWTMPENVRWTGVINAISTVANTPLAVCRY